MEAHNIFWGKLSERDGRTVIKPLWTHLIDVTNVAHCLWEQTVPFPLKEDIARSLGSSVEEAGRFAALYIGLHDIGKAIPGFQVLHPPVKGQLEAQGLRFAPCAERIHHGHASVRLLMDCANVEDGSSSLSGLMAMMVGWHHGRPITFNRLEEHMDCVFGGSSWKPHQKKLIELVAEAWCAVHPVRTDLHKQSDESAPPWLLGLAGWATLADWAGSMTEHFPETDNDLAPLEYVRHSRACAQKALEASGLNAIAVMRQAAFGQYFTGFTPSALQAAMEGLDFRIGGTLTMIEAPTGDGKTEAALYLSALQQAHGSSSGLYMAMPTMATSNGLFGRMCAFLANAHDTTKAGQWANVRLAHGKAALHEGQGELLRAWETIADVRDQDSNGTIAKVGTAHWFMSGKRSLLAPYGIGTIDQALTGILSVKHFFLRLYGLAGKTVIFDEVHAYDLYMQHELHRLMMWLKALGCHVILLSATLPKEFRNAFFTAWGATPPEGEGRDTPYPAVWQLADSEVRLTEGFACRWGQQAQLERIEPDTAIIAQRALEAARAGATVGVICNLVKRAQETHAHCQAEGVETVLFHARYTARDRNRIEQQVLAQFGKGRPDGQGAILIATQVAEQSLDLDFDLLISDLAPIDLLLQRAGRLHRHVRQRPKGFERPVVLWAAPSAADGELPSLKAVGAEASDYSIYSALTCYRTYLLLGERDMWSLPEDYRALIEKVYGDQEQPDGLSEEACKAWDKAVQQDAIEAKKAEDFFRLTSVPRPEKLDDLLWDERALLEDPDEDNGSSLRARTRLGDEGAEVLVLFEDGRNRLFLDEEHLMPMPSLDVPGALGQLMLNTLRISNRGAIQTLRKQEKREDVPEHPLLRHCLVAVFDTDGTCRLDEKTLRYTAKGGMQW